MASDLTQIGLVIGVKALIDTSYAAQTGKNDPVVALVSNGLIFSGLVIFAGLSKLDRLAAALAYVLLIGSLVMRGLPLVTSPEKIVSSTRN